MKNIAMFSICIMLISCNGELENNDFIKEKHPLIGLWLGVSFNDGQQKGSFGNDFLIEDSTITSMIYPYDKAHKALYQISGDSLQTYVFGNDENYQWIIVNDTLILKTSRGNMDHILEVEYRFQSSELDPVINQDINEFGFNSKHLESNIWVINTNSRFNNQFNGFDSIKYQAPPILEFDSKSDYFISRDIITFGKDTFRVAIMNESTILLEKILPSGKLYLDYKISG